jgi:hypothetical protein
LRGGAQIALIVGLCLTANSGYAHHSFAAEYDAEKRMIIKGTITKFDLINPHSWLYVSVKEADGKVTKWNIEMGSPNALIRRGINKTSVPVGAEVTIDGYRARDNSTTLNASTVKTADGRELFASDVER